MEPEGIFTAFTTVHQLSLTSARSIQSTPPHPTSRSYILILCSHLRLGLPSGLFPSGLPTKILNAPFLSPICATCTVHLIQLNFIAEAIFGEQYTSQGYSLRGALHSPLTSYLTPYQQKIRALICYENGNVFLC